jgi:Tfp pilus assembly protein PilN
MRPVNLLPSDASPGRTRRLPGAPVLAAAAAPVVAVAAIGGAWSTQRSHVSARSSELAAVQAQVEALQAASGGSGSQLAALEASRRAALDDALARRQPWDATLDAIARVLPKGVALTELGLQSPTPAGVAAPAPTTTAPTTTGTTTTAAAPSPAPAAQGLTMSGTAPSNAVVAYVLARLALVPGVSNVTLQTTQGVVLPTGPAVQFQLAASIAGSGS